VSLGCPALGMRERMGNDKGLLRTLSTRPLIQHDWGNQMALNRSFEIFHVHFTKWLHRRLNETNILMQSCSGESEFLTTARINRKFSPTFSVEA
jgi:hypothetical protein